MEDLVGKHTRCSCGHTPGARLAAKAGRQLTPCDCGCHATLIGRSAPVECNFTPAAQWVGKAASEPCDAQRFDAAHLNTKEAQTIA
jgi:hypothetical protein